MQTLWHGDNRVKAPEIIISPGNLIKQTGEVAVFGVSASGTEPLNYCWQRNGSDLADDGRISGSASRQLVIRGITYSDAGDYRVRISNTAGAMTSNTARLEVRMLWLLNQPFDPATQDTVLATIDGIHQGELVPSAATEYLGSIFYWVRNDGTAEPSKVYRYNPSTGVNSVILSETSNHYSCAALTVMQGKLYISHESGKVWVYDGINAVLATGTPFNAANAVSAMASFQGKMYFGTKDGHIYESATGASFVLRATIGFQITALQPWRDYLYGVNAESSTYASKIFRSANGSAWTTVGTFSNWFFDGLIATPSHLYATSMEDPGWASFSIRATTDGTNWSQIFYTSSEGKGLAGRPTFFSQDNKAYCLLNWLDNVDRLVPISNGVVESRIAMSHGYTSLVELDGRLYGIGSQSTAWGTSPTVVSLLGTYRAQGMGGD
jgi:hypothetical protein